MQEFNELPNNYTLSRLCFQNYFQRMNALYWGSYHRGYTVLKNHYKVQKTLSPLRARGQEVKTLTAKSVERDKNLITMVPVYR